ncbi:Gfo/Idh/MocA family oxidoreductase [Candidatus Thiosymbion oneisti]|uniref:Gfo/Idh/MocA family oxidoreductase n=1 Tax=Candidatus Thiosymbion oneisti TaxID=589554 RepID=UPI00159EFD34|nr:Gfo/Idh/MocA family oxidoreductase [Candidatus Thiosymbion oneisti]
MKCIRVGHGHVATWHDQKLKEEGVTTIGVMDSNEKKRKLVLASGLQAFSSYEEAFRLKPDFWDICVSTDSHLDALTAIISLDLNANIIVEKPICSFSQINMLKNLLENFQGKIVVNENYVFSNITKTVKELSALLNLKPTRIISEMTKNRISDIRKGRFLDLELFAFGYEGSHMIINVLELGEEYFPGEIKSIDYDDMYVDMPNGKTCLPKQGMVEKRYIAKSGAEVILYTSMIGDIKYYYPGPFPFFDKIVTEDNSMRYRILAVEDNKKCTAVVGFYEPVLGLKRGEGAVVVFDKGDIKEYIEPIYDDTMGSSLKNAIDCFLGKRDNPHTVAMAIKVVELSHFLASK